jgi:hypothetical protein
LFEVSGYFDWTFALIKTHLNKFVGKSLVRLVILALKFASHIIKCKVVAGNFCCLFSLGIHYLPLLLHLLLVYRCNDGRHLQTVCFFLYAIKCMLIFGVKLPIRYPFHEIWVSLRLNLRWILYFTFDLTQIQVVYFQCNQFFIKNHKDIKYGLKIILNMLIFGVKLPIRYPFHEIWVSLRLNLRWMHDLK